MKINDYKYKAKRLKDGKIVRGVAEGPTKAIVDQFLLENGLRAIEIEETKSILGQLNRVTLGNIIKPQDLIFYLKQLSSLLRAGVKINEACEILATQQTNKNVRRIYYGLYYDVNSGSSLSDAFKNYPKEFPKLLISLVSVGEKTGDLEDVLNEVTGYFEQQHRLKSSIRSTMMMPAIYMIVAIAVAGFLMVGVLPQFEGMYASLGGDLPGVTVFFMNMGNFVTSYWYYILGGLTLFVILIRLIYKKFYRFQYIMSVIAIRAPIFGEVVKLNNLSRIASTLAQMLKNHVPLQDSIDATRNTIDNKVYNELLGEAKKNVNGGELMSMAFEHHYASETVFVRMMSVGERTSELGKMMKNLSEFYDEDSEIKVDRLKKALEPLMLIFIYVLIVIMILAVILPSLSLSDQLQ